MTACANKHGTPTWAGPHSLSALIHQCSTLTENTEQGLMTMRAMCRCMDWAQRSTHRCMYTCAWFHECEREGAGQSKGTIPSGPENSSGRSLAGLRHARGDGAAGALLNIATSARELAGTTSCTPACQPMSHIRTVSHEVPSTVGTAARRSDAQTRS